GREVYAGFCAGCHGPNGKGGFAPELNNAGFLRAANDGFLQATVIRGRRGTAMRSFGIGGHGLADLTQDQVNDVVAHIRQWSPDKRRLRRTEAFPALAPLLAPAADSVNKPPRKPERAENQSGAKTTALE
ncbi:MAG: cytochrome c, partial [Planctomycetales bacterium]